MADASERLEAEAEAFDAQIEERLRNGYVPDLRRCKKTPYFYNNEWRDPAYVKLSFGAIFELLTTQIDRLRERVPRPRVLEVGCGPGYMSLELARHGYDVVGVDVSGASIRVAQRFADEDPFKGERGELSYRCSDFLAIEPFPTFDAVVFLGSLHHFHDCDKVVRHARSLLREGGLVLVHEPTRDRMTRGNAAFVYFLRTLLSAQGAFFKDYPVPADRAAIETAVDVIYREYKYEGESEEDKVQSPNDNESGFEEMMPSLRTQFEEVHFEERAAFFHENIGGLRLSSDAQNHAVARFLRDMDRYLCELGVLQSLEFFFVGRKK